MAEDSRKKIAVVFGGRSAEHEISLISGLEVLEALDTSRYEPIPVYIDVKGRWFTGEALFGRAFYRALPGSLDEVSEVALLPTPGIGGLRVVRSKRAKSFNPFVVARQEVIPVDAYFPVFHGQFGEDGCVQGLFELADVVYTGCGVLSSAIAMNKYHCKSVLNAHGIPVLPSVVVNKQDAQKDISAVREQIQSTKGLEEFPLFVKPVNLGSSVGISKAEDAAALDAGLAKVFQYDSDAIVEPCVTNLLEINVSVLEGSDGPDVSVVEVPVASDGTLTYEDKYMRGGKGKGGSKGKASGPQRIDGMAGLARVIDPEDLNEDLRQGVISYAEKAYKVLGCAGVVRFDFMVDTGSDSLYFNELNPLPGSLAHYLWAKSKPAVVYTEMLNRIIEGAFRRKEQSESLQRDLGFKAFN